MTELTLKQMIKDLPKEIDDYLEDLRIRILKTNMAILNDIWSDLIELPRNLKSKSTLKAYSDRLNEISHLKNKLNELLSNAERSVRLNMLPIYKENVFIPAELRIKKEFGKTWEDETYFRGQVTFYDLNENELKIHKNIDKTALNKTKELKEKAEKEFGYTLKQLISEEKQLKQASTSARKDIAAWNAFLKKHKSAEALPLSQLSNTNSLTEAKEIVKRHSEISKESMKMDLIRRTYDVCGRINKMANIVIGGNGSLNGVAYGEKRNAYVETIPAGGYNIQCFHYRVLIKPF
jgi:paraquat-inducible protein B